MSISSQPQSCLTQSQIDAITTDTITISNIDIPDSTTYNFSNIVSTDTITWSGSTYCAPSYNSGSTITIGSSSSASTFSTTSGTISISPLDITSINDLIAGVEWKSRFPDWDRIQQMCESYPGLKIAFEKFKTTYYLVKDDYDNPNTKK